MFIQQIIIDGFKSYAQRTVIDGFDPHFNAITGLNGSGKSNILDAICFVLGITNLSQVRAGNLSELVYKQGQAGITKASVTLLFDNTDTSNSPVGYEACSEVTVTRQVLLGGKSKYLINGKTAPVGQVTNLFHSVQLNVNNPHFLIMQGRITKVLNMKPPEILGLIEEAAGTRMYETKRVAALKTIDKKQTKLDELNAVLREEITPTLERLRNEKQDYLNWCKNNSDLERAERFCIAADFYRAVQALQGSQEGSEGLQHQVLQLEQKAAQCREAVLKQEEEMAAVSSKLGGELKNVHSRVKAAEEKQSMELVKFTSTWQNFTTLTKQAQRDLRSAESLVEETRREVEIKQTELASHMTSWEQQKQEATQADESLTQLTLDYQNMSAGIALTSSQEDGEENQGLALPDQICQAHNESKAAESKAKQAQMKIEYLKKTLKSVEQDMKKQSKSADQWNSKRAKAQAKLNDIRSQLERLNFSEAEYESLEKEHRSLSKERVELQDQVDTLTAQLESRLAFQYSDPVRGFDRSKVKGMVAKLVKIFQADHATAVEVAAGGKLYQIVVDEAITSKALLQNGQLKRRVTFVPLDKVQTRRVPANACDQASNMAARMNSKLAVPALDLIGFDEEVRNAMEYVFGTTLVVDGMDAANAICDATKTRTVTLDGDVYDPSGTISGGSRDQLGSTLSKLMLLSDAKKKLDTVIPRVNQVQRKLDAMKDNLTKYEDLSGKMELATAELEGVTKHLSQTSYGIVAEKFKELSAELAEANEESERMRKEQDIKWALYEDLKEREVELTQKRGNRLKEIDEAINQAKKETAEKAERAREAELNCQTVHLELDSLREEVAAAELAVEAARKGLKKSLDDENEAKEKLAKVQAHYEEARAELKTVEDQMALSSAELMDLANAKTDMVKKAESAELEAKKLSVAISRVQKERKTAEHVIETLQKKHTWIENEKSAFGVSGGDYDFEATNAKDMTRHLETLKDEQTALAKKINKKVMGMIERAEGEYNELMRKRKVVENDKKKIQAVIEELDVKKKSELERTWVKVNGDFGSIFSTLLPGASAKLEPPQGMQAWEGLEVKVAFGDVWKDSLSELSGGQRSLLALSLVLSLLLFKPAPMYILDEVDAALDLSHTQNIGNMLKTHFSQSQFIVVSLKEGMFNNANVIFRTKFVDGVSTVTRTIGAGSSREARRPSHHDDKGRNRGGRVRLDAKENAD